jgi:hypothetical protein
MNGSAMNCRSGTWCRLSAGAIILLQLISVCAQENTTREFPSDTSLPSDVILEGSAAGVAHQWRIPSGTTITIEGHLYLDTDAGKAGPVTLDIFGGGTLRAVKFIRFGHSAGSAGPGHLLISDGSSVIIEDGFQVAETSGSIQLQGPGSAILFSEHLVFTVDEEKSVVKFPRRYGGPHDTLPLTVNGGPIKLAGYKKNASVKLVARNGRIFQEVKVSGAPRVAP